MKRRVETKMSGSDFSERDFFVFAKNNKGSCRKSFGWPKEEKYMGDMHENNKPQGWDSLSEERQKQIKILKEPKKSKTWQKK